MQNFADYHLLKLDLFLMMVDTSVKFEIDGSLQKLLIVNQKCYNMDNPEDDGDMIHMCLP